MHDSLADADQVFGEFEKVKESLSRSPERRNHPKT